MLRATIGMMLSAAYRVYDNNLDAAYNVLATMLNNVKDTELRKILQNDIARYKKTLFGGYKYIG